MNHEDVMVARARAHRESRTCWKTGCRGLAVHGGLCRDCQPKNAPRIPAGLDLLGRTER